MAGGDELLRGLWRAVRAGDASRAAALRDELRASGATEDLARRLDALVFRDGLSEADVEIGGREALAVLAGVAEIAASGEPWDSLLRRPTAFRAAYKWGHVARGRRVAVLLAVRDGTRVVLGVGTADVDRLSTFGHRAAPGIVWPKLRAWPEPTDPWETRAAFGDRLREWARETAPDRVAEDAQLVLAWAEGVEDGDEKYTGVLRNGGDDERVRGLERRVKAGGGLVAEDNLALLAALSETEGADAARRRVSGMLSGLGVDPADPGFSAILRVARAAARVPASWEGLLQVDLQSDEEPRPRGARTDDSREVDGRWRDGARWQVRILSGTLFYWGEAEAWTPDGRSLGRIGAPDKETPLTETFDGVALEWVDEEAGVRYVLDVSPDAPRSRRVRRNPGDDERMRELERLAAAGDEDARSDLYIAQEEKDGLARRFDQAVSGLAAWATATIKDWLARGSLLPYREVARVADDEENIRWAFVQAVSAAVLDGRGTEVIAAQPLALTADYPDATNAAYERWRDDYRQAVRASAVAWRTDDRRAMHDYGPGPTERISVVLEAGRPGEDSLPLDGARNLHARSDGIYYYAWACDVVPWIESRPREGGERQFSAPLEVARRWLYLARAGVFKPE